MRCKLDTWFIQSLRFATNSTPHHNNFFFWLTFSLSCFYVISFISSTWTSDDMRRGTTSSTSAFLVSSLSLTHQFILSDFVPLYMCLFVKLIYACYSSSLPFSSVHKLICIKLPNYCPQCITYILNIHCRVVSVCWLTHVGFPSPDSIWKIHYHVTTINYGSISMSTISIHLITSPGKGLWEIRNIIPLILHDDLLYFTTISYHPFYLERSLLCGRYHYYTYDYISQTDDLSTSDIDSPSTMMNNTRVVLHQYHIMDMKETHPSTYPYLIMYGHGSFCIFRHHVVPDQRIIFFVTFSCLSYTHQYFIMMLFKFFSFTKQSDYYY